MHNSVHAFLQDHSSPDEFTDKVIIEAGALNVNGTCRDAIMAQHPRSYIGTDMRAGLGVDQVIDAGDLAAHFHDVDVVICTEMMEHAEHWRAAITAMKTILRPQGVIYLTTRSLGFPLHDFPGDFWRYSVEQMARIFSDFTIDTCMADPMEHHPGVFIKAIKPRDWIPNDLTKIDVDPVPMPPQARISSVPAPQLPHPSQRNW